MRNISLSPFKQTFGLPPGSHVSDEMIINSMPVFEITPCKPHFEKGLNLFNVEEDFVTYNNILANHGYTAPNPINLAFIADNFPTDSFVNDYGETFLQKFTDVASQGMSQMAQMMGATTATDAARQMGLYSGQAAKDMKGTMAGKMLNTFSDVATGTANQAERLIQSQAMSNMLGTGGANVINKMVAGHRVDFPQIWRNSSYTPSYTATVRLYNPNPGSNASTKHHIIGPLAVILCLSLPRTTDGNTFSWPFFHQIEAKGIYNLSPSVITNVTVVKGGDQQQIAFNQRMGVVDVRIDFVSLFNSILLEENGKGNDDRPSLRGYLKALETEGEHYKRSELNKNKNNIVNSIPSNNFEKIALTKEESMSKLQSSTTIASTNRSRTETKSTSTYNYLKTQTSDNFVKYS